jgi:ABC-type glycerol-3-phosphate transport system substrate-binding protein
MEEITLSIFHHSNTANANMNELLKKFEQREKVRVRLEVIPWSMGWQRLVEMALYHTGPDISELGSTWILDFVRMNALRPFSEKEVEEIRAGRAYFDASWSGCISEGTEGKTIWAVPLGGDARVIFYRRDLLKEAGIDEATAFAGPSRFDNTLARLQQAGVAVPLALPTGRSRNNLHSMASWIWGMGGDFLNADGQQIEFDKSRALDGFKAYFGLGRYLGSQRNLEEYESDAEFMNGHGAVTISGYWILHEQKSPEVEQNLGMAVMPVVPFVGGEHLVIWKHSRHQDIALRLAQFLTNNASSEKIYPHFGLPVTIDGWKQAPFNEPRYQYFLKAMQGGRSFPTSQLWGLVEKRLTDLLADVWNEVLASPERADVLVENQIGALAKRLRTTLRS